MTSVVRAHHIYKEYGGLPVLEDLSFEINPGEVVSIIGPSGCGKTTLLHILAGLTDATSGDVRVNGLLPREAVREKKSALVTQRPVLLPWRTILQNISLPLELASRGESGEARELLELVGLKEFGSYYQNQLSGGMQQRAAFARALLTNPELLFLDEPFGALDQITRAQMGMELLRIIEARRATVVLVTHSISEAVLLSDRVVVLSSRPAKIESVVEVSLPRPRNATMVSTPEYQEAITCIQQSIYAY